MIQLCWKLYSHKWKPSGTKGRHTIRHPNKQFSLWDSGRELDTQRCGTVVQKTILVKVYSEKGEGKKPNLPLEALQRPSWNSLGSCLLKCSDNDHQGKRCVSTGKQRKYFLSNPVNTGFKSLFSGHFPTNKKWTVSISLGNPRDWKKLEPLGRHCYQFFCLFWCLADVLLWCWIATTFHVR